MCRIGEMQYGKYRIRMNADAWLYGTTTTKEFTGFLAPVLEETADVPVTDGSSGSASLFTQIPSLAEEGTVEFLLKEVERAGDGGLRLSYQPQNRKM